MSLILEASYSQEPVPKDWYQQGIELKQQGNYQAALEIWLKAKDNLQQPSFRIGQAFLELATQHKMKSYYKDASVMYYWGLEDLLTEINKNIIEKDLETLTPLVPRKTEKKLEGKIKSNDSSVLTDIKIFWKSNDLTPLTNYNERLLEHFERVNYSRENFTYGKDSKFDDRAIIYIKYGSPDYKKNGQLRYNSGVINLLLDRRLRTRISSQTLSNSYLETEKFNLESSVRQLHKPSKYELWIYNDLNTEIRNNIYLFGTSDGSTKYESRNSLEDFIPNSAFRKQTSNQINSSGLFENQDIDRQGSRTGNSGSSNIPQVNITPAILFQIMYYRQFSAFDRYFSTAYEKMINRFSDPTLKMSNSLAQQYKSENITKMLEMQSRVPVEKSELQKKVFNLPVEHHFYRFLDEKGTPYLKVFLHFEPSQTVFYDQILNHGDLNRDKKRDYNLYIGIVDNSETAGYKITARKEVLISSASGLEVFTDIQAPYKKKSDLTISSQLIGEDTDGLLAKNSVFQNSTKAINNFSISVPNVLDNNNLEISDLIIGYNESNSNYSEKIPFAISHDRKIPIGKNLNIYNEIYNLAKDKDGIAKFNIGYRIEKDGGFLSFIRKKANTPTITIANEIKTHRFYNALEIKTSNLESGEYKLNIVVDDLNADKSITKEVKFKIEEQSQ